MRRYHYVALDRSGQEQQGSVEADDKHAAGGKLRMQGLYLLELNENQAGAAGLSSQNLSAMQLLVAIKQLLPVSSTQKVFFFRQIALMLRSGLSLTESLKIVQQLVGGRLQVSVDAIRNEIQSGDAFSSAIAKQGELFPDMAQHMIRSAEASGQLDEVMARIADHMERKAQLKRQIMTTLFYPVITLLLAVAMFIFLVTGVIPKFAKFFENSGKPIPPETQSLMDLAAFMTQWGPYILVGVVMGIMLLAYSYRQEQGRLILDRIALRIPLVGGIISFGAMAQSSWTLAMLLRSGLPLVEALNIVKQLVGNRMIADAFHHAAEQVLRGRELGGSLQSPYVPNLVQQLASVGERSGSLEQIMQEAGVFYQQALEAKNKTLGTLIEPVAILIIGGMVAYVYIAFFKAIFAISGS